MEVEVEKSGQECVKFNKAELVDVMVSKACHSAIPLQSHLPIRGHGW